MLRWSVFAKLPLVFLLLDALFRRETSKTAQSLDWCHIDPAKYENNQNICQQVTLLNGLAHGQNSFTEQTNVHICMFFYTKFVWFAQILHRLFARKKAK
jgi:hypothetical protein